jgi:hypothetical protein
MQQSKKARSSRSTNQRTSRSRSRSGAMAYHAFMEFSFQANAVGSESAIQTLVQNVSSWNCDNQRVAAQLALKAILPVLIPIMYVNAVSSIGEFCLEKPCHIQPQSEHLAWLQNHVIKRPAHIDLPAPFGSKQRRAVNCSHSDIEPDGQILYIIETFKNPDGITGDILENYIEWRICLCIDGPLDDGDQQDELYHFASSIHYGLYGSQGW